MLTIELTHSDDDIIHSCDNRLARLGFVIGVVCAELHTSMLDLRMRYSISKVEDHKGFLTVFIDGSPMKCSPAETLIVEGAFIKAWYMCGENLISFVYEDANN